MKDIKLIKSLAILKYLNSKTKFKYVINPKIYQSSEKVAMSIFISGYFADSFFFILVVICFVMQSLF